MLSFVQVQLQAKHDHKETRPVKCVVWLLH